MKKSIFFVLTIASIGLQAQEKQPVLDRAFWQEKPDLQAVKSNLNGFKFSADSKGDDPLSMAISNDASAEVISFLASQPGVSMKKDVHEGRTYLHSAVSKGNAQATEILLKKGADMYYADAHDQTALTYGGFMGSLSLPVIEVFVKNGLDVKKKYEKKNNADLLLLAAGSDRDFAITSYLLSKGLAINSVDKSGATAITYAAKYGNIEEIKKLVEKGVKAGNTDIIAAAQGPFRGANKIDIYKYLIEDLKLTPTATNENGQNALHIVGAKAGQEEIIAYLFSKGIDINQVDKEGNTPFMNICKGKSAATVELVLPKVKDINLKNSAGESALTNAVKSSGSKTVELLLNSGADAKVIDAAGNGLAFYLVEGYQGNGGRGGRGGFGGAVQTGAAGSGRGNGANGAGSQVKPQEDFAIKLGALKAKGISFTGTQKDGSTLYHLATAKNDLRMIRQLEGLGIDVNAKDKNGMTALHKVALIARDETILKYLVSIGAKKDILTAENETAYELAKDNEFLAKGNVSVDFLK